MKLRSLGAALTLALSFPLSAQTKPDVTVPAAEPADAKSLVQMLLKQGKIMRSADVKRGMRGVGRSVFQGTKIENFQVEVLGVLERVNGGGDIVLIKVLDGPVVKRQSGIIAGMSGSPVYINGKLLGAIALGWGFPKEPIGGVTPITSMIETSLPDSQKRSAVSSQPVFHAKQPIQVAGQRISRIVVGGSEKLAPGTARMRPATTLLQVSGYSEKSLPRLKQALEPYQIEPVIGPSSKKTGVNPPFTEGGAIGVQLVSGDMDQTAIGTITYRIGNRILAFGHPMFGLGAASLPMTTAYVHDIFPSYQRSFKLGSPVRTVGALQQDTTFAIGGTVGAQADMIPMTITMRDDERHIQRAVRVRVMKDPMLTPQLIMMTAQEAIEGVLGQPSEKMVRVGLNLELENAAPIKRRNYLYSAQPISGAAMVDLAQSISLTQRNEFARGDVKRVDLSIVVEPQRKTLRLKQLVSNRNKAKPGDTVQVSAVFEPTDTPGKTFSRTFDFKVPDDAPSGVMRLAAGPSTDFWLLQTRVGGAPPTPVNLPELVNAFRKLGSFNELLMVASTPQGFLKVDQQKLPSPPPAWARLLRTSQSTAIGAYNETEERREALDFVILNSQLLTIPIENPDQRPLTQPLPGLLPNLPGETPRPAEANAPENRSFSDEAVFQPKGDFETWLSDVPFLRQIKALHLQDKPIVVPPPPGSGAGVPTPPSPNVPTPTPTPSPKATPTPTPVPDAKTLGRPAQSWVQDGPEEFMNGRFDRALLTSSGEIHLAPLAKNIASTPEPFVWSIAGDGKGNIFLGTGNNARLFKVDAAGQRTVLYQSDAVAVTALTADKAGNVYAALTPGGKLLRIAPDGTAVPIFEAGQDYIWALTWDAQGRLLIGSGGTAGKLFRLRDAATRQRAEASDKAPLSAGGALVVSLPQKHIRALSAWGEDAIFVGTGDDGVLLRVDARSGATQALFEVPAAAMPGRDNEVLAVAAAPEGVYFGTSASGTVYRWRPAAGVEALYPSPQQAVYALHRTPDGGILAATGNKGIVYLVAPGRNANDTVAARVLEADEQQALALAMAPNGDLLVGTGNSGAAYRVSMRDKAVGTFTSTILDAKNFVRWGAVRFTGRGVALETRSGNTNEPDKTWSDWQSVLANELGELRVASPDARFLQYRARLNPDTPAPALVRVEVLYRARNSAPTVTLSAPAGGEFWKGKKRLTWTGKDPDSDTLRYRAFISGDSGATWKPLEMPNDEAASLELDTTKFADGTYIVRVEASDEARNPEEIQRDESISLPFTIDNTPPRLEAARDGAGLLRGVAQDTLSPIAGAEWRFVPEPGEKNVKSEKSDDAKEPKGPLSALLAASAASASRKDDGWQAMAPGDGLFDSRRESAVASPSALKTPPGAKPRKIEVRAQDAAGNSVTVEVTLEP